MLSRARTAALLPLTLAALFFFAGLAPANPRPTVVPNMTQPPYSAIGRLFVTYGDGYGSAVCTATAIDSPSKSLVLTAGHCLREYVCERCPLKVARSERFIPAYDRGRAPFGVFVGESWKTPRRWRGINSNYDMAVISVASNARGEYLTDAIGGGLGIAMNQPRNQSFELVGYPGGPQRPMRACAARFGGNDPLSYQLAGPPTFRVNCFMGDGASGGPLLIEGGTAIDGMDSYSKRGEKAHLHVYSPYFSRRTIGALLARFER